MAKYKQWISKKGLKQIKKWAEMGLKDKQIMELIGIKHRTFYYWIERYPDFKQALKDGRKPQEIDTTPLELYNTENSIAFLVKYGNYSENPKSELELENKRLNIALGHKKRVLTNKIKKLEKEEYPDYTELQHLKQLRASLDF